MKPTDKPTIKMVREAILWGTVGGCCETCDKYRTLSASLDGYVLVKRPPSYGTTDEHGLVLRYGDVLNLRDALDAMLKEAE